MYNSLAQSLQRKFDLVQKNQYSYTQHISTFEYFTFILNNETLEKIAEEILCTNYCLNDNILMDLMIVSIQTQNYSLLHAESTPLKKFCKKMFNIATEEVKNPLIFAFAEKELDKFEDEKKLNNFTIFHNKILDRLFSTEDNQKTKVIFSSNKGLYLKSNPKKFYKPQKGSARLTYLQKIIKSNGKILHGKDLVVNSYLEDNKRIVLSNAIKEINQLIISKLSLKNNVILTGEGYHSNTDDYEFIID